MAGLLKHPERPGELFYQDDAGNISEVLKHPDRPGELFVKQGNQVVPMPGEQTPPVPAPPAPPSRDIGEQALRAAEFGSRGVVDSAAEWAGLLPELAAQGMNKVGAAVGHPGMFPQPGYYPEKIKQGFNAVASQFPNPLDLYDGANVGPPENALERGAYGGGRGVVDAASMLVPGAAIARGAKAGTTLQGVGNLLRSQPGMQAAAGAVGGSVSGATENPYLGMAASMAVPGVGAAKRTIERMASKRGVAKEMQKMVKIATEAGDGDLQLGISRMKQRIAAGGDETAIVDVGGDAARRTTRAVSAVGGKGSELVDDFVVGRASGRGRRLHGAADNLARDKYHKFLDLLGKTKRKEAAPLYEEAFKPREGWAPWDARLQRFLDEPEIMEGMAKGIKIQRLEAIADDIPFRFEDYAVKGFDDKGNIILGGTPNLRAMDAAKRGLDAKINAARSELTGKVVWTEGLRALDKVRGALVNKLDDITTDRAGRSAYKEARAAWSGPSQLEDAAVRGRRFLLGDEEVTAKAIQGMSFAERQAFRIGARRQLTTMINTDTQSAVTKLAAKKEDMWRKLRMTFPDDGSFDDFQAAVKTEIEKARTEKFVNMRAQSQTGPIGEDIKELSNVPSAAANAADKISKGNWMGAVADYAMKGPKNWMAMPNQEVSTRLAKMLTEMAPAEQKKIFDGLSGSGVLTPAQQKGGKLTASLLAKLIAAQQGGQELQNSYGPRGNQ